MTMTAVRAGDFVSIVEVHAHSGGDRFLTRVKMYEPGNFTGSEFDVETFLELPNRLHRPVSFQ
jgi:hypothetical protein